MRCKKSARGPFEEKHRRSRPINEYSRMRERKSFHRIRKRDPNALPVDDGYNQANAFVANKSLMVKALFAASSFTRRWSQAGRP